MLECPNNREQQIDLATTEATWPATRFFERSKLGTATVREMREVHHILGSTRGFMIGKSTGH